MANTQTKEVHTFKRNIAVKLSNVPSREPPNSNKEADGNLPKNKDENKSFVEEKRPKPFKTEVVWFNAIGFLILHVATLYGFYRGTYYAKWATLIWAYIAAWLSAQSILLGAHRCYTHKAFKATLPLRFLIVFWQTVSSQNCLWVWVRDHRQHHKYTDTNADPHNASRGFFFSHIGWLMTRKHPDVIFRGRQVDMSDIEEDALVMFQKKYYNSLYVLLSIMFPMSVAYYGWNETLWDAFFITFIARTFVVLNIAWLVNSWAHMFGTRPYNKDILPTDSRTVSFLTFGEGWHNYHHTFPWDYKAAELGRNFNFTATLIEWLAKIGWAYDLKTAPPSLVEKRAKRCGDGTHHIFGCECPPPSEKCVAEEDEEPYDDLEPVAFYENKKRNEENCIAGGNSLNGKVVKSRGLSQRG